MLAVALPVLVILNFTLGRSEAPFALQQVLAWPGYMWMALLLYLLLALAAGEIVRPLLRRVLARRATATVPGSEGPGPGTAAVDPGAAPEEPEVPGGGKAVGTVGGGGTALATGTKAAEVGAPETEVPDAAGATASGTGDGGGGADASRTGPAEPSRRLFIARTVAAGAAAVAFGTVGAGTYGVLNGPTLKRVTVPLAKLPRAAHGYRIAVVSDIHLGRGPRTRARPAHRRHHQQRPARPGRDRRRHGRRQRRRPRRRPPSRCVELRARHGSFFVTGNHEYFGDAGEWIDHVRELGVHPLENARRELPGFDLAGVNDLAGEEAGEGPDFGKALGDRDTSRASVLLAHQPVQIHEAVDHGVDLQLSGHTHGGQLWPAHYLAALANPTVAGLERYGDTQLYVTRGAGAWGPPVRVGAESDVTIVQLASKQA